MNRPRLRSIPLRLARCVLPVVTAALCLAAPPSLAEPPASIRGAAQDRARDSFEHFAQAWMDKVHRLAAEERQNPTIQPGAEQVVVTYRGYGEDFSVELRPTGHPASPFVGLLRYSELLYTCTEPKASDCTVASSVPVTEIFRLRDGRWSY